VRQPTEDLCCSIYDSPGRLIGTRRDQRIEFCSNGFRWVWNQASCRSTLVATVDLGSDPTPSRQTLECVVRRCITQQLALGSKLTLQAALGRSKAHNRRLDTLEVKPCQGKFGMVRRLPLASETPDVFLVFRHAERTARHLSPKLSLGLDTSGESESIFPAILDNAHLEQSIQ
jgi:hypothetical protein